MARLSARNQVAIAVALIVVLAVAFIGVGIVPLILQARDVDAQIESEKANLVTAQALVARRQSAKAQSAQNEVELMRIANQVPDAPQLPSVIIELQDVANAAGLDFPQITVGELTPGRVPEGAETASYSALPVALVLRGEWADIIEFNRKLASLNRGVRVTSSTFTYVPESDTAEAYVEANIMLEVYVMAAAPSSSPSGSQDTSAPADATQTQ